MRREELAEGIVCYLGDCREILPTLPRVDAVLTDPPYGITANAWDAAADLSPLWAIRATVYVVCAGQPYTSQVVCGNRDWFKHEWIWIKDRGSNFANTVREPMKEHESVLVFAPGKWTYNKQMQQRAGGGLERVAYSFQNKAGSDNYREFGREGRRDGEDLRVPASWQFFKRDTGSHPTQKPLELSEYFLRTYSNELDLVLDPFMGSGTTGVACVKLGRKFIGIEIEPKYFDIACKRISEALKQPDFFVEKPKPAKQEALI